MAIPAPQPGMVISYSYLWHRESGAGQAEGRKDRPCVIVVAVDRNDDETSVMVVPVTHAQPLEPSVAVELPLAVKRRLDLDDARSWVLLNEGNSFIWPGHDLRRRPDGSGHYDYGLLPPRLFETLVQRMQVLWRVGRGRIVPRD